MTNNEAAAMIRNDMKLHHDDLSGTYRKALRIAVNALEAEQPTADVVEVVRCKDCTYRKKNTFCLHNMRYEQDNGFCSYGERRTK